ncbi:porin [Ochrobactrum sp. CM-21-5]|nr:porin [Ochrobactrum sp. CM-21-5]MBC2884477.1 porin [Ochrobactrum sp. CM-21-5]
MKLKTLFLSSVAALVTVGGARAADAVVAPEPEATEYVRVCDAYGAGYFYIPGTETCLRVSGYVRFDLTGGDDVYARGFTVRDGVAHATSGSKRNTWNQLARTALRFSTASETDLGTLKTYADLRFQWENGKDSDSSGSLRFGYIQLGGLRVGLDESAFVTFPGYLGSVIDDDVILAGGYRTGLVSYTFESENGVSAILSLEQGNNDDTDGGLGYDGMIKDYTPHVVGGLRYAQGWGSVTAVAAYDARNEEWAGKVRGDVNISDRFSLWAMGGYKTNKDKYVDVYDDDSNVVGQARAIDSFYGAWGGDWAFWGGATFKATQKASLNAQIAYDASKTFAASANVAYDLVPGFTITPEISYVQWKDKYSYLNGQDAWQGMVRFQRSF